MNSPDSFLNCKNTVSQFDRSDSTASERSIGTYSKALSLVLPLLPLQISKSSSHLTFGTSSNVLTSDVRADSASCFNNAMVACCGTVKAIVSLWVLMSN